MSNIFYEISKFATLIVWQLNIVHKYPIIYIFNRLLLQYLCKKRVLFINKIYKIKFLSPVFQFKNHLAFFILGINF